ncbi:MAG: S-layer homology domain-containing protein [Oscillospiraceae bacterium]|nr:S-layer homology domain-containing protein [Oscillospiraceae bacterium]
MKRRILGAVLTFAIVVPLVALLVPAAQVQATPLSPATFVPVTNITDVPSRMFVGRQLQLRGTVNPTNATGGDIQWSFTPGTENTTGAFFDDTHTILIAQSPGLVRIRATIPNGRANITLLGPSLEPFVQDFSIWVSHYVSHSLAVRAEPGGFVAGGGQFPSGESVSIFAMPHRDFIFAGWHSGDGARIANPEHPATTVTMPGNDATVTAFFTFVGGSGGSASAPPAPQAATVSRHPWLTSIPLHTAQARAAEAFSDIDAANWFSGYAGAALNRGWISASPTAQVRFRPSDSVTLAELAVALHRMAGSPTALGPDREVLQGQAAAIEWLRASGILTTDIQIAPSNAMPRQDVALVFDRLAVYMRWSYSFVRATPNFADDREISQSAQRAVTNLFRAHIIGTRENNHFAPRAEMTRAEFVAVLVRFAGHMDM